LKFLKKLLDEIFYVEPFLETPLQVILLRLYVKQVWQSLGTAGEGGNAMKIAIFGAGRHTAWLLQVTEKCEKQPVVVAVLDDSYEGKEFHGYAVMNTLDFNPASADLILISSDTAASRMEEKCKELYHNKILIMNMYRDLPPGPYHKEFNQFDSSPHVS